MIQPLSDIVIIRRLAPQQVSDGGIHLVYDPDYREDIGEVAYVGPGKKQPVAVKPGDKVLFSTNGHQITHVNGEELVVLREPSIIGVFE
jgi:chaperonin GroES